MGLFGHDDDNKDAAAMPADQTAGAQPTDSSAMGGAAAPAPMDSSTSAAPASDAGMGATMPPAGPPAGSTDSGMGGMPAAGGSDAGMGGMGAPAGGDAGMADEKPADGAAPADPTAPAAGSDHSSPM